jgi:hypothetical protein
MGLEEILAKADPEPDPDTEGIGILVDGKIIHRIQFADDLVVFAKSPEELEKRLEAISKESMDFGLMFNVEKTVIMRNSHAPSRPVKISSSTIKDVEQTKYLGRMFRKDSSLEGEVSNRIRAAWASFHNISEFLSHTNRGKRQQTLFTYVIPAATYGAETWNAKSTDYDRIQRTMNSIWEAANAGEAPTMRNLITIKKLTWAGHVARQPPSRWSHRITMWDPRGYVRKRGRPTTRWSDEICAATSNYRSTMAQQGRITESRRRIGLIEKRMAWSTIGKDRDKWKVLIHCYSVADNGSLK